MRDEYEISKLNPRENPYAKALKQQITINLNWEVVEYLKIQAENFGITYQTLINLYSMDCLKNKRKPDLKKEKGYVERTEQSSLATYPLSIFYGGYRVNATFPSI